MRENMAVNQIISSVLIILYLSCPIRCDFTSIDYHSKDLSFQVPSNGRDDKLIIVSTPKSDAYSKNFYFNHIDCDLITNNCEIGQYCFNCPKSTEVKKCHFKSPYNDTSFLGQVSLTTLGEFGEHVVVDWASNAIVNETSVQRLERKVQVINIVNCLVRDIPVELSSEDNGMRKLVLDALPTMKSFDVFYIDYRTCGDSGWVRMKYNENGQASKEIECIVGLEKSKRKFFMDVVMATDFNAIMLDKNQENWVLYELKNRSNYALEFHKGGTDDNGDLFDIARLSMHADNFGSLCWLPDIDLSYSLNCTIFRVQPKYVKNLQLDFHYKVRDFELKIVDFKRIYVLTSSSDDSNCIYDLWLFDINGQVIDGPLKIQGPRCVFTHRLDPRPIISQLNRDNVCVSFAFERSSRRRRRDKFEQKQFTAMTECFSYTPIRN